MDDENIKQRNKKMGFIEIQTPLSRHSSFSSIADDQSFNLNDDDVAELLGPPLQPELEDSLNLTTILAAGSFERLFENSSFDVTTVPSFDVSSPAQNSRKRTISQHDETATTFVSSSTTFADRPDRPRFYSERSSSPPRSLSQQFSVRDVASMLGSLSILDSSEQLKSPSFHHRGSCDQLPDADELLRLKDEKSHRRNTQVVLISETP
ncbi:hypothetical protein FisN_26Hu071 [Fistulifera solaris]|uniref:Uncharacterized protein n=1 Tax=Fistulifera solaris TaxID=1519565 RepID=A0A1Z5JXN7_FISSO|nr:hypothetical protein FisN_26Hu071 [Fistulifera solaris]|eukprot:GAX18774.1 hypothetical protein FisN_26Hu071 [Fistulifera solaris]